MWVMRVFPLPSDNFAVVSYACVSVCQRACLSERRCKGTTIFWYDQTFFSFFLIKKQNSPKFSTFFTKIAHFSNFVHTFLAAICCVMCCAVWWAVGCCHWAVISHNCTHKNLWLSEMPQNRFKQPKPYNYTTDTLQCRCVPTQMRQRAIAL